MKLTKKITTISTIVTTCITSVLLLLLIFFLNLYSDTYMNVVFTFGAISIGGFFTINSINMMSKNKILAWISLSFIVVSVLFVILSLWDMIKSDTFLNITYSLSIMSILFNIIVSIRLSMGKNKNILQIVIYSIIAITDILTTLFIFGATFIVYWLTYYLALIVLSVLGIVVLLILAKKSSSDVSEQDKNFVKISKTEYEMLIDKSKKYDELVVKIQNAKNKQK